MTREELIKNDGYWEGLIDIELSNYKGKNYKKKLTKAILELKNELIQTLSVPSHETPKVRINKQTRKDCSTCRHGDVETGEFPCSDCGSKFSKWEAI